MTAKITLLTDLIQPLADFPYRSRIHRLKTFSTDNLDCYVKRDDELSFGISGSKLRKYLSLIPYLKAKNIEQAILIGSTYSNNILGLSQLLIENGIEPILFLLGHADYPLQGNFLLTCLLVSEDNIHWISRSSWAMVDGLAQAYCQKHGAKAIEIIAEGASMPPALPGALTLALDIISNEQQHAKNFDHIFIDAGTGLIAIATLLAYSWLQKEACIHVVLLAEQQEAFFAKLKYFQVYFEKLVDEAIDGKRLENRLRLYRPSQAKSFGAVNSTVLHSIMDIAKREGILTDPLYSAKLFPEAAKIIRDKQLTGNALIVHSGGGLALFSYQEQLAKLLKA